MNRVVLSLVVALLLCGAGAEAQEPVRPNVFSTLVACQEAMASGWFRFYEPKYFGLRTRNPTNGEDRIVVALESDTCLEMLVVSGRRFVAQREGTPFRAQKLADGSLALYARNDCGNPVYGVVYPTPAPAPVQPAPVILREPVTVVPLPVRREPPPSVVLVSEKKGGFCSSKKCRLTVLVIAGGAGYAAWRYWPCPPGTVRR